jgi:hypothetical protein
MEQNSAVELNMSLLFKKFAAFYKNQVFITTPITAAAICPNPEPDQSSSCLVPLLESTFYYDHAPCI